MTSRDIVSKMSSCVEVSDGCRVLNNPAFESETQYLRYVKAVTPMPNDIKLQLEDKWLKQPCDLSGAFSPEIAFIIGGGPHTRMRLSSLGSGNCFLAMS